VRYAIANCPDPALATAPFTVFSTQLHEQIAQHKRSSDVLVSLRCPAEAGGRGHSKRHHVPV
jgi:hypothetical protein